MKSPIEVVWTPHDYDVVVCCGGDIGPIAIHEQQESRLSVHMLRVIFFG